MPDYAGHFLPIFYFSLCEPHETFGRKLLRYAKLKRGKAAFIGGVIIQGKTADHAMHKMFRMGIVEDRPMRIMVQRLRTVKAEYMNRLLTVSELEQTGAQVSELPIISYKSPLH